MAMMPESLFEGIQSQYLSYWFPIKSTPSTTAAHIQYQCQFKCAMYNGIGNTDCEILLVYSIEEKGGKPLTGTQKTLVSSNGAFMNRIVQIAFEQSEAATPRAPLICGCTLVIYIIAQAFVIEYVKFTNKIFAMAIQASCRRQIRYGHKLFRSVQSIKRGIM